jgi:hypothetical protein
LLPIEEIPEEGNNEDLDTQIGFLTGLNNCIKVLSESRAYLEILRNEMVQNAGIQASRHLEVGTEL